MTGVPGVHLMPREVAEWSDSGIKTAAGVSGWLEAAGEFSGPESSWLFLVYDDWTKCTVVKFQLPPETYEGFLSMGGMNGMIRTTIDAVGFHGLTCVGFCEPAHHLASVEDGEMYKRAILVDDHETVLGIFRQRTFAWRWTDQPNERVSAPEIGYLHDLLG